MMNRIFAFSFALLLCLAGASSAAPDLPVRGPSGFVESGGEQIYFESHGEGPTVVLSHGLGGNHAIWYQQVPVLARSFRVVTWDQRGFGRSSNVENKAGPASFVEDLKALLDHLEVERAHIVGQSMGGWTTVGFALKYPERVASVTMADTIGGIYTPAIEAHFDAYIQKMTSSPPPSSPPLGPHPALGARIVERDLAQAFLYSQIASVAEPAPANVGLLLRMTKYDASAIAKIAVPVLFVVGSDDPIFPPAIIREAASLVTASRVIEMPGAGHSPYFETPENWNGAVLEFLTAAAAE